MSRHNLCLGGNHALKSKAQASQRLTTICVIAVDEAMRVEVSLHDGNFNELPISYSLSQPELQERNEPGNGTSLEEGAISGE